MARTRTWLLRSLLSPALLAAAFALEPAPARACSYAPITIEASYPDAGALDVPTNAVLFLYGPGVKLEGIHLLDADGEEVQVEVQLAEPSGFDVRPLEALEPQQQYELRGAETVADYPTNASVKFTTGSGPAAVPESMTTPELAVKMLVYGLGTCGTQHGFCLDTSEPPPGTTLELRIGEEVIPPHVPGRESWALYREYGRGLEPGDCVELRARDVRGRRSAPSIACGAAIQQFQLENDPSGVSYDCANYLDFVQAPDIDPGFSTPVEVPVVAPVASPPTGMRAPERDVPVPREVTLEPRGPSAGAGGGCALTSKNATGTSLATLSIGWIALLSSRRRRRARLPRARKYSEHFARFGAREIPIAEYRALLARGIANPVPFHPNGVRPLPAEAVAPA